MHMNKSDNEKKVISDTSAAAAMESLKESLPFAAADPTRPAYHMTPPACWMNDPNGGIYHHGWYHIFYLHDPFSSDGESSAAVGEGRIIEGSRRPVRYWGHARSEDLVHWEHMPVAIGPVWERGELKPISGSIALNPGGRPMIFYSSVGLDSAAFTQCAAISDPDLVRWSRIANNPVLSFGSYHGPVFNKEWRDPFVFSENGRYFMIIGAELDGASVLPIFEAVNDGLDQWEYRGILFSQPKEKVKYFECPKFFKLQGRWVLITSPYGPVQYFIGRFDPEKYAFTFDSRGFIDYSPQHYATENIMGPEGSAWIMGWLPGWNKALNNGKYWNGCFSLPRLLSLDGRGNLLQKPAPQLKGLRENHAEIKNVFLNKNSYKFEEINEECMEIYIRMKPGADSVSMLKLFSRKKPAAGFDIRIFQDRLEADGIEVSAGETTEQSGMCFNIFIDRCIIEVFINDGRGCVSGKIHEYEGGAWGAELKNTKGSLLIEAMDVWKLKPAYPGPLTEKSNSHHHYDDEEEGPIY